MAGSKDEELLFYFGTDQKISAIFVSAIFPQFATAFDEIMIAVRVRRISVRSKPSEGEEKAKSNKKRLTEENTWQKYQYQSLHILVKT